MRKRQTIIVCLAATALIYGLYQIFFARPFKSNIINKGQKTENSVKFAAALYKDMLKKRFTKNIDYILSRALADWRQDVFLTSGLPTMHNPLSDQSDVAALSLDLTYSGYLEMHDKRLAIINGREYEEGEEIAEGGFIVHRILPARITIGEKGQEKKISVELRENESG